MASLKGLAIFLFIFVGAIIMTFVSTWIIMIDSQWHLGQRVTQAAALISLSYNNTTFLYDLGLEPAFILFLVLGSNMLEVEHAIFGLSPSSYFLYFLLYLFIFMIVGGIIGAVSGRVDLDPLRTLGFSLFVIGGAIITTYIAIYIVTIDAQWHLRTTGGFMILFGATSQELFLNYLGFAVATSWSTFEHSVGQSASSYVLWFIGFTVMYIVITAIITWISRGKYVTR